MRLPGPFSSRSCAFNMVGLAGIAVAFSFFAECRLSSDSIQIPRNLQASPGNQQKEPEVCQAKSTAGGGAKSGGEAKGHLQLTATKGAPLKFKCGTDLSLRPTSELSIFQVGTDKTCESGGAGVKLADELTGASLSKEGGTAEKGNKEDPVYVFNYPEGPQKEKHLCYTCVSTTTASPDIQAYQEPQPEAAGKETVACTVYITVPKKAEESSTSSSTPAPDSSPSSARAMPGAIATAAGGFLAVMVLGM